MESSDIGESEQEYDFCLSFAGEQRVYVEQVARRLRSMGIRVFYDDFEKAALWGEDLYERLDWIYRKAAKYCVVFISADYARKNWPTHERKSAQARAFSENEAYILPVRFDDAELPGLRPTVGYVDVHSTTPIELADLLLEKIDTGPRPVHYHRWPAAYGGRVWIWIIPQAEHLEQNHEIRLRWGRWLRRVSTPVGEHGITLLTSKSPEEAAAPLKVEIDPPARALFGAGEVKDRKVLDIEEDWAPSSEK